MDEVIRELGRLGIAGVMGAAVVLIMRHLLVTTIPELQSSFRALYESQATRHAEAMSAERDLWLRLFEQYQTRAEKAEAVLAQMAAVLSRLADALTRTTRE